MIQAPPPRTIPFTAAAFQKLQANFDALTKERILVMQRLQVAREMGDLSENGAYHYAKFELGSIGRQLRDLRHLLDNGYIVAATTQNDVISFGKTVTLQQGKRSLIYTLVSQFESNPQQGKLSQESPLGIALDGKKVGDVVHVQAPAGKVEYTIQAIA